MNKINLETKSMEELLPHFTSNHLNSYFGVHCGIGAHISHATWSTKSLQP